MIKIVETDQGQRPNLERSDMVVTDVPVHGQDTAVSVLSDIPVTGQVSSNPGNGAESGAVVIDTLERSSPVLGRRQELQQGDREANVPGGQRRGGTVAFRIPKQVAGSHVDGAAETVPAGADLPEGEVAGEADLTQAVHASVQRLSDRGRGAKDDVSVPDETGSAVGGGIRDTGNQGPPDEHTEKETFPGEPPDYFPPGYHTRLAALIATERSTFARLQSTRASEEQVGEAQLEFSRQRGALLREADDHLGDLAEPYVNPPAVRYRVLVPENTPNGLRHVQAAFTKEEYDEIVKVRNLLEGPKGIIKEGMSGKYPQRDIWYEALLFPREKTSQTTPSLAERSRAVHGIFGLAREVQFARQRYGVDGLDPELVDRIHEIEMLPLRLERHASE